MNVIKLIINIIFLKAGMDFGPAMSSAAAEITQQLDIMRSRTDETAEDLRRMEQEQESFALQYHECTKINGIYFPY